MAVLFHYRLAHLNDINTCLRLQVFKQLIHIEQMKQHINICCPEFSAPFLKKSVHFAYHGPDVEFLCEIQNQVNVQGSSCKSD